jgi:hypothetical protein
MAAITVSPLCIALFSHGENSILYLLESGLICDSFKQWTLAEEMLEWILRLDHKKLCSHLGLLERESTAI